MSSWPVVTYDRGDYDNAVADFTTAIRLEAPNRSDAYLGRFHANAKRASGPAKLQSEDRAAVPTKEHDDEGAVEGEVNESGHEDVSETPPRPQPPFADLDSAIRLDPHNPRALLARATALRAAGTTFAEAARRDLNEALRWNPRLVPTGHHRAGLLHWEPTRDALDRAQLTQTASLESANVIHRAPFPAWTRVRGLRFREASSSDVARFLGLLAKAAEIYPRGIFWHSGLKYIVPCADLQSSYGKVSGLCDFEASTIYCDVARQSDSEAARGDSEIERVIHHEFFHFLSHTLSRSQSSRDHQLFRGSSKYVGITEAIKAQEAIGAQKGQKGPPQGFVSWYAQASPDEDEAETFAEMVLCTIDARASEDHDVDRKRSIMIRLAADFECPLKDDFWDRAKALYGAPETRR